MSIPGSSPVVAPSQPSLSPTSISRSLPSTHQAPSFIQSDAPLIPTISRASTTLPPRPVTVYLYGVPTLNAPVYVTLPNVTPNRSIPTDDAASIRTVKTTRSGPPLENVVYEYSSPKLDDDSPIAVGWEWVVRVGASHLAKTLLFEDPDAADWSCGDDDHQEGQDAESIVDTRSVNEDRQLQFAIRRHPIKGNYDILTLSSSGVVLSCRPVRQKNSVLSVRTPNRFSFDAPVQVGGSGKGRSSSANPNANVESGVEWCWKGSFNRSMTLVQYKKPTPQDGKAKKSLFGLGNGGGHAGTDEEKIVLAEFARYSSRPALHLSQALPTEHIPLVIASMYPIFDCHRREFAERFNVPEQEYGNAKPSKWDSRILMMGEMSKAERERHEREMASSTPTSSESETDGARTPITPDGHGEPETDASLGTICKENQALAADISPAYTPNGAVTGVRA